MSEITCFESLPTEVIIEIFGYLSVADRYKSFFDCNIRLRLITKQRTEFSRKNLNRDILRFSTLHSWYKHLEFADGGTLYFIVPRQGEQERYHFNPQVTDRNGLHWWFLYGKSGSEQVIVNEKVRAIINRYPIRLNPFFYHSPSEPEDGPRRFYHGGDIIMSRYKIEEWLKINYPEHAEKILSRSDYGIYGESEDVLAPVFDGEWSKATTAINSAAVQIWNELKELIDVNPFQTQLRH